MDSKEKIELLKRSDFTKVLSFAQIFVLMWWDLIRSKKLDNFYQNLSDGMIALSAFKKAKNV